MTTTDIQQDTLVGIRAVYEDRQYDVGSLGRYFSSVSAAWSGCIELAAFRAAPAAEREKRDLLKMLGVGMLREAARRDGPDPERRQAAEANLETLRGAKLQLEQQSLVVRQLRIESPMEITLAVVQGGGVLGVSAYSIHLLRQVLHDPERVGSWMGRLVEGWHSGMAGAEAARSKREQTAEERQRKEVPMPDASRQLMDAASGLAGIRVVEVETIGAGDPPDDLLAVTDDLPDL